MGGAWGEWTPVWANFGQRRKAEANDRAVDDGVSGEGEPDMFAAKGIAAE